MLHRDMIPHVRDAFEHIFTRRSLISVGDIKEEWLCSIRDEQPRWMGPEIAATLLKHIGKQHTAASACERIARLYAEMLKANWGRGPYLPSITKELARTVHAAVIALAEPVVEQGSTVRKADWGGAKVACQLIHAFRKILYPDKTPANIADSIWRALSTCTLPLRNQSSRSTKHVDTWCDMLVRYSLVESAKMTRVSWAGAHAAREIHPELTATILCQIQSAERGGLCSEAESDILRAAFGMGERPEGQMGADFEFLADVSLDDLLLETGDQASELGSVTGDDSAVLLLSPEVAPAPQESTPTKVVADKPKRSRPAGSTTKRRLVPSEPIQTVVATAADEEPVAKTRRLVSALDSRDGWRRNDGTLYSYYRVTASSFNRVAHKLANPTIKEINPADLLCTDEAPLTWADGALPHEEPRLFAPLAIA